MRFATRFDFLERSHLRLHRRDLVVQPGAAHLLRRRLLPNVCPTDSVYTEAEFLHSLGRLATASHATLLRRRELQYSPRFLKNLIFFSANADLHARQVLANSSVYVSSLLTSPHSLHVQTHGNLAGKSNTWSSKNWDAVLRIDLEAFPRLVNAMASCRRPKSGR